jgi:hypothetical protein
MYQTNLSSNNFNHYGDSRGTILLWGNGIGAMWFNRRMKIYPRYEVHLKAWYYDRGHPKDFPHKTFSIVMSGSPNTIGSKGGFIGFNNVIIFEIDINDGSNKPHIETHHVKGTIKDCSSQDWQKTPKYNWKVNQNYRIYMGWDKTLPNRAYYSIMNQAGVKYYFWNNYNHVEYFGNTAYAGFVGLNGKYYPEIHINGTFLCEDLADINKVMSTFSIKSSAYVGETISFTYYPRNNLNVDTIFYTSIETVSAIFDTSNGCSFNSEDKSSQGARTVRFTCKTPGTKKIGLSIVSNGKTQKAYKSITISVKGPTKVTEYGHDSVAFSPNEIIKSKNQYELRYNGKQFLYSSGLSANLVVKAQDSLGNIYNGEGKNSDQLKSILQITVDGSCAFSSVARKNNMFAIYLSFKSIGRCNIKFGSLSTITYFFNVLPAAPNPSKTNCALVNYSSTPKLNQAVKFDYRCSLKDAYGNAVPPKDSASIYGVKYTYKITKTNLGKEAEGLTYVSMDASKTDYLVFTFQTKYMGQYKIEVLINNNLISNLGINTVIVNSNVVGFKNAKFYTISDPSWKSRTDFTYKADPSGLLLLIDFTDSDGKTYISNSEYPPKFNPKEAITTSFTYPHAQKFAPQAPTAEMYKLSGKPYIALRFPGHTDQYIKRNSRQLTLNINVGSNTHQMNLIYPLDIAPYTTCLYPLEPSATVFVVKSDKFVAGNQYEYFEMRLMKDSVDLHNYREKVELKQVDQKNNNAFNIIPHKKIDGIYNVEISAKTPGKFTVEVYVADTKVKNLSFVVSPNKASSIALLQNSPYEKVEEKIFRRKEKVDTDSNTITEFNLLDYLGNIINLGMKVDVQIKKIINGRVYGKTEILSEENFVNGHYVYEDKTYEIGEYEIIMELLSNGDMYYFKYTKVAGSDEKDVLNIVFEDGKIYPPGTIHMFDIYYYNQRKVNLVKEEQNRDKLIKNTSILVTVNDTQKNASFSYVNNEVTVDYGIRYYTPEIKNEGKYKVTIKYGNMSKSFNFIIGYEVINSQNSILVAKTTFEKLMLPSSAISLNKLYDVPKFKFYYLNEDNKPIYSFKSNPSINARIEGNGINKTFNSIFNNPNGYVEFEYPENFSSIQNGLYFIILTINNQVDIYSNYSIYIDDQKDVSEKADYVVKNTYFPFKSLETVAGVKESFTIELKTDTFKRYDNPVNTDMIKVYDSKNLINNKLAEVTFKTTQINGQIEISIRQIGIGSNQYIFSLKDPKNPSNWQEAWFYPTIITRNAELGSLEISPDDIKSDTKLKDGIAGQTSIIKMTPRDIFGNYYSDFFNEKVMKKNFRDSLVSVAHSNQAFIKLDYSYDLESQGFFLEFSTETSGTVEISSPYFKQKYTQIIKATYFDPAYSQAILESNYETKVGSSKIKMQIIPKDIYGNPIENLKDLKDSEGLNIDTKYFTAIQTCENSESSVNASKCEHEEPYICFTFNFTEKGKVTINPVFNEKITIPCSTCSLYIKEEQLDHSKTIVMIEDAVLYSNKTNEIDTSNYPVIKTKLFDKFGNQKQELNDITITGSINNKTNKFDLIPSKEFEIVNLQLDLSIKSVRDEWTQLDNGIYNLNIKIDQQDYSYQLNITNSKKVDEESLEPVNHTLTSFYPEKINVIAGRNIIVEMKQFGKDGKRYNKWYDNPDSSIKLTFNNNKCSNKIYYGSNPGIYLIEILCTQSFKSNDIKITVDNIQLEKVIPITVKPSFAKSLKISNYKSITSVNDNYIFTITPYDEYNNVANIEAKNVNVKIKSPSNSYINSIIMKNREDNSFDVKLFPKEAGEYTIESPLISEQIKFKSETSNYNAANSMLYIDNKSISAGGQIIVNIIPFDDQNNYKEPDLSNCPYKLTYRNMGTNEIEIKDASIRELKYNEKKYRVYAYPLTLNVKGINLFNAKINEEDIYCMSCSVIVSPKEIDLSQSLLERYVSESNSYEKLINYVAEDNFNGLNKYRLFPKDMYGNNISIIDDVKQFSLKLTNSEQSSINCDFNVDIHSGIYSYVEFVATDDNKLKNLPDGLYSLAFKYGQNQKIKSIYLKGAYSDYDKKDEKEDLQKTTINNIHLYFEAGKEGFFYIQINSEKGYRKNTHDGYSFKITPTIADPSFKYSYEKSGTNGVFIIKVSSTKAVTDNQLKIEITSESKSSVILEHSKPKMTVIPGKIKTVKINDNCIKPGLTDLKDTSTDKTVYKITLSAYDEFGNENQADENIIKLSLNPDEDKNTYTIKGNFDGSFTYKYNLRTAGQYKVLTEYSDFAAKKRYLENIYNLKVNHGAVSFKNSIIENLQSTLKAGKIAKLKIDLRDKNDNFITPTSTSLFNAKLFTDDQTAIQANVAIVDNYLLCSAYVTKAGIVVWSLKTINNEEVINTSLEFTVVPSEIDVLSVVYSSDRDNQIDKNRPYIISNTAGTISLSAAKFDIYGNIISEKNEMKIFNVVLTGNHMEDISFLVSEKNTKFDLDTPNYNENETAAYTLKHLVKGYGYNIKLEVSKNEKSLTGSSTTVKNANELNEAIKRKGIIIFGASISTSDLKITVDTEINLKGYTLTVKNGLEVEGDLIVKNGTLSLTATNKALVKLLDGAKYFGYNVNHKNGKSAIYMNGNGYVEIEGGSISTTYLFENAAYITNKIVLSGKINASSVKNPFVSKECDLKIYGGNYGFETKKYAKSSIIELPVLLTTNKDDTGYGNGPFCASKTEISQTNFTIPAGEEDFLTIIFKNEEGLLFNDEVDYTGFDQIVITPIDKSLKIKYEAKYSQSTITISSTVLYKNGLNLKITDKKGKIKTFDISCNIRHGLNPDSSRTELIYPHESVISPPNNYISFTFKLFDKFGNPFEDACSEMSQKVFSLKIDEETYERKSIDNCDYNGALTINKYFVSYPPFFRKFNLIYYLNDVANKVFSEDQSVTIKTAVDFTQTDVQCPKCQSIKAGEKYNLYVSLFDSSGQCFNGNYKDDIPLGVKISLDDGSESPYYFSFKYSEKTDDCNNKFEWIYDKPITKIGIYKVEIFGKIGNQNVTFREYTQIIESEAVDPEHIYVKRDKSTTVKVGEYYQYSVYGKDKYNNEIKSAFDNVFKTELRDEKGNKCNETESIIDIRSEFENNKFTFLFKVKKIDPIRIYFLYGENQQFKEMKKIFIDDEEIKNENGVFDTISFTPGDCSAENARNTTIISNITKTNQPANLTIRCFDEYGYKISKGGQKFIVEIFGERLGPEEPGKEEEEEEEPPRTVQESLRQLDAPLPSDIFEVKSTLTDNLDGTYTVKFTPDIEGYYTISIKLSETISYFHEKIKIVNVPPCPKADDLKKTFKCHGLDKCVEPGKEFECLTNDELCLNNKTHPFNCKLKEGLSVDKCVSSFSDCSCPPKHARCTDWYQNQCYPIERDYECPFVLKPSCKNQKPYSVLCDDGVCRLRKDLKPNKYVCPYPYYQCSDLTCRLSPQDCPVYNDCDEKTIKCDDQSCQSSNDKCPSRITCINPNHVVCPNGSCVENELLCTAIECFDPNPYLCPSGVCAKDASKCPSSIVCGHSYSLCEDNICRHDCRELIA